jgi:hypothetical protein
MKAALPIFIAASILATSVSTAYAKPRVHKKRTLSAAKAAALSLEIPAGAELAGKPSFWIAADPHVPLAVVNGSAIRSVGKRGTDCGSSERWAKPGSRWRSVDAWGQSAGVFEVAAAETFDVTACRELSFTTKAGKPGSGLFVSADSGYAPPSSAAFAAPAADRKHFEKFLGAMESAWVNQKPLGKLVPWGKRTMFFEFAPPKDAGAEGRVDGAGKPVERPKRWAVAGGPMLVVAYLGDHGQWKAASVNAPLGLADSYTPVAVFDMNGDGIPEIIVRTNDGPNFADRVLSLNPKTMTWEAAAESPGGAAL